MTEARKDVLDLGSAWAAVSDDALTLSFFPPFLALINYLHYHNMEGKGEKMQSMHAYVSIKYHKTRIPSLIATYISEETL